MQARSVIGDNLERFNVFVGLPAHDGVDSAGVVTDHATDGAAIVAGWIGSESEVVLFGGIAQVIENDSGLDLRDAVRGIDFEDFPHVPREIENDRYVATLTG